MEQLTTTSILSLFETTKEQRTSFVNDVVGRLMGGDVDPLKVHMQVKAMEDIITQLTSSDPKKNKNIEAAKQYKSVLIDAAKKMEGKTFSFHGGKFEIKEAGTKWHYDKTEDFQLSDLEAIEKEASEAVKKRQEFLKTLPSSGMDLFNEASGELVRVYPPYKTSTETVQVTLK